MGAKEGEKKPRWSGTGKGGGWGGKEVDVWMFTPYANLHMRCT